jgi:deoxyribodipyrimidine photo-lyase
MNVVTNYADILAQIATVDPLQYAKTRNFLSGAVTKLSPYISRGVISTVQVYDAMLHKGYTLWQIEKFVQELCWRDYFQQVWRAKKNEIDADLKQTQSNVLHFQMAASVLHYSTGITAIDDGIQELYTTGYMHNHLRMYTAAICCNIGKAHWFTPAKWMYYHLLDGDWASNALSWQWVAGSFSSKKYVANQENINKYCGTNDKQTFLDVPYEAFEYMQQPAILAETVEQQLSTNLPNKKPITIDNTKPTYIYNSYNLDPEWSSDKDRNSILLLEPNHFKNYPVADKVLQFILSLAKNIENIQIYVGQFEELVNEYGITDIHYKEHPTTIHYTGTEHSRDWLAPTVVGYFPSFFGYWKKVEKQLKSK